MINDEKKEYEKFAALWEKYMGRAEEVFNTWTRINPGHFSEFEGASFYPDKLVIHCNDGDVYEPTVIERELPLEYLFSDAWVEELETKLRLEREEAARKQARMKINDEAAHKRIFGA
jgi:hypothetical protein